MEAEEIVYISKVFHNCRRNYFIFSVMIYPLREGRMPWVAGYSTYLGTEDNSAGWPPRFVVDELTDHKLSSRRSPREPLTQCPASVDPVTGQRQMRLVEKWMSVKIPCFITLTHSTAVTPVPSTDERVRIRKGL